MRTSKAYFCQRWIWESSFSNWPSWDVWHLVSEGLLQQPDLNNFLEVYVFPNNFIKLHQYKGKTNKQMQFKKKRKKIGKEETQKRYIKNDSLLPPDKYKQFGSLNTFSSALIKKNTLLPISHPLSVVKLQKIHHLILISKSLLRATRNINTYILILIKINFIIQTYPYFSKK